MQMIRSLGVVGGANGYLWPNWCYGSVQEGFTPAAFKSSRSDRTGRERQQQVEDFMDEDELAERTSTRLQAAGTYDTFAATAEGAARGAAGAAAARRHGDAAEGLNLFPAEALRPVQLSVGMQLLQKMGWRPVRCCSSCLRTP